MSSPIAMNRQAPQPADQVIGVAMRGAAATTATDCELRELDGRLLGSGLVMFTTRDGSEECVVVALPRPGRIIQRCLVDGLQDVEVSIGPAAPRPARVGRLVFSADYGRVCVLCLPAQSPAMGSPLSIR